MPARVTLTIAQGQQFAFEERTTALVGKEDDCLIRFPKDAEHHTISRHHCLFDINPPDVRVRDLGSRNGTFVNGKLVGKRDKKLNREDVIGAEFADLDLNDGDEVRVGPTTFLVSIHVPVTCSDCGVELTEEHVARFPQPDGEVRCERCRQHAALPATAAATPGRTCAHCGIDLSENSDRRGQKDFCSNCRGDLKQVMQQLLDLARSGSRDLLAIDGYAIEMELGRGGMGAVYLASHSATGRRVALKVMLPQVALGPRARELFLREAHTTRVLQHRHIVRLFDLGCSRGSFFFTMEYCAGGSLADLVRRSGKPLPPDKAVLIIVQALKGLEYAHTVEVKDVKLADGGTAAARGLVHRDIKPGNIFLGQEDGKFVAKVGDYGLGKAFDLAGLSGLSVTGASSGTPVFMPRQQLVDYKYARPEVDVWASAATLYYLLTLHFPRHFQKGKDPWQVVLQTDAVPIRERAPDVPPKLAAVIDKALVDRPEIPFKTAVELREALQHAVS